MIHHICQVFTHSLAGVIELLTSCHARSKTPASPTLSAQEGELDNLLSEPTTGWDDDIAPPYNSRNDMRRHLNIHPEAVLVPKVVTRSTEPTPAELRPATWIEGRTLEELEREEAELAKLDPPGPPMDEFGEFEEGKPVSDPLGAGQTSP